MDLVKPLFSAICNIDKNKDLPQWVVVRITEVKDVKCFEHLRSAIEMLVTILIFIAKTCQILVLVARASWLVRYLNQISLVQVPCAVILLEAV